MDQTQILDDVRTTLRPLLGPDLALNHPRGGVADAVACLGKNKFLIEVKGSGRSHTIAQAKLQLDRLMADARWADYKPLVIVEKMGRAGQLLCEEHGINWADLSGNAEIRGDGLLVRIRGQRLRVKKSTHTAFNPFSRRASRVVHVLLLHPHAHLSQSQIGIYAAQPKGTVSRTISALNEMGLIEMHAGNLRTVQVVDWERLLDSWLEGYHAPEPYAAGLVSSRDGREAMQQIAKGLRDHNSSPIFSGLAAAASYTNFGSFRRVLVYTDPLPMEARDYFHVSDDTRGRNVFFVRNDGNARLGSSQVGSVVLASPILTLMDLAHEPERSEEASDAMRRTIRNIWR